MLRYSASFVVAAYAKVRLAPHDLRASPAELFTQPSNLDSFQLFTTPSTIMGLDFSGTGSVYCHP